ncbi:MAG: hypothetical protein WCG61_06390 [Chlorobium sp.]
MPNSTPCKPVDRSRIHKGQKAQNLIYHFTDHHIPLKLLPIPLLWSRVDAGNSTLRDQYGAHAHLAVI